MNLLLSTIYLIFGTVLTYIAIVMITEIRAYLNGLFYRKQGIPFKYIPLLGLGKLFMGGSKNDPASMFKEVVDNNYNPGLVAFNVPGNKNTMLMLIGPEICKDFWAQENDVTYRQPRYNFPLNLGFFFKGGAEGLHQRKIFKTFFTPEILEKQIPKVNKILEKLMKKLTNKIWGDEDLYQWKKVNFQELTLDIFEEFTFYILFGENEVPKIEGEGLARALIHVLDLHKAEITHPLNILTADLPETLGLSPKAKEIKRRTDLINSAIIEFYEKAKKRKERGLNLIDLMLSHNEQAKANGKFEDIISDDLIIGNILGFIFGGSDTTRLATNTHIYFLSKNSEIQEDLYQHLKSNFIEKGLENLTLEKLGSDERFNLHVKEAFRLHGPVLFTFRRNVIKDFRLKKYRIKKGDKIIISSNAVHYTDKAFEKPMEFDINRFTKENKKKFNFADYRPFQHGKRSCMGKYVADILFKTVLLNLLQEFEFGSEENIQQSIGWDFLYGMHKCPVYMRKRK